MEGVAVSVRRGKIGEDGDVVNKLYVSPRFVVLRWWNTVDIFEAMYGQMEA
jgi:hypothetical protein